MFSLEIIIAMNEKKISEKRCSRCHTLLIQPSKNPLICKECEIVLKEK